MSTSLPLRSLKTRMSLTSTPLLPPRPHGPTGAKALYPRFPFVGEDCVTGEKYGLGYFVCLKIMNAITFAIAAALFHLAPVQTVKKCEKIDVCRCSTDEGEINLWSLGSESPGQPRYVSSAARWVLYRFLQAQNQQSQGK